MTSSEAIRLTRMSRAAVVQQLREEDPFLENADLSFLHRDDLIELLAVYRSRRE